MSAYVIGKGNIISQELNQLDNACHIFSLTTHVYDVEERQCQTSLAESMINFTVVPVALQRTDKLFTLFEFEATK